MATSVGSLLRRTRVVSIVKSRVFIATTAVCTGTLIAVGIAQASIPDPSGVIHSCYKPTATAPKLPGKIRVIDSPTKSCVSGEVPLNWRTKGELLYQDSSSFNGPYTSGQTVATFTNVPAGLMCVTATASAFTTSTPAVTLQVSFFNVYSSVYLSLVANENGSHKALVGQGTSCNSVQAGTYSYKGSAVNPETTSDAGDVGSISVQVFAN